MIFQVSLFEVVNFCININYFGNVKFAHGIPTQFCSDINQFECLHPHEQIWYCFRNM